jgi:lysophospholipid acyltransferase (LPLAT)-like uncharacterized protein
MFKRLLRSDRTRSVLARIGAAYMRLVFATTRWQVHDRDRLDELLKGGAPLILGFWHGRLLLPASCFPSVDRVHVLISLHRDGRFIAETISHIGLRTVDGSTGKRGAAALRDMARTLTSGDFIAITPDGPRGPRMRAAPGAVALARLAGATILPLGCSVRRGFQADSWDRFLIPMPFNRGVYRYGEPLVVPAGASAETMAALTLELERRLTDVMAAADRDCGRVTPPAGPPLDQPAPAR